MSAPIEILPVGRGAYALAWSAPWGAAAMIVRRFAADAVRDAVLLGSADRTRRDAPRLFHLPEGVGVAWCEDDGAYLAVLGEDGLLGAPRPLLPGGRALCLAAGRRSTHVFADDGEAVHAIEVRAEGTITRASEPLIEQSGRVRMCAARAGDASLLFAAYEGERRVAIVDAALGPRSRVRHELPAPCRTIDAVGVGMRAGFALTYEGLDTIVEAGIVDGAGKMVERRHEIVHTPGALHAHARVTWIEEGFHVVAQDARAERATVIRLGDRTPIFEVAKVSGAFAVAYHEKRFVLAQSLADGDAPTLRLSTSGQRGEGAQTIELREPAPAVVRERRAEARAQRCLDELEGALGSSGYRDARSSRIQLARGAGLTLPAERQHLELRPEGDRFRLVLRQDDTAQTPARDGTPGRIARWIRERLRGGASARERADRALATELATAIGGELAHVERSDSGLRVEVVLRDPPDGARLAAWLHTARRTLDRAGALEP